MHMWTGLAGRLYKQSGEESESSCPVYLFKGWPGDSMGLLLATVQKPGTIEHSLR